MNFKEFESDKKLSGSYYTPSWIAEFIMRWVNGYSPKSLLEPSCGDGVFFDNPEYITNVQSILAFDIDPEASGYTQAKLGYLGDHVHVICQDFMDWAIESIEMDAQIKFDAVVGNPPFIRYQYLENSSQMKAQRIFDHMGIKFTKHTNAWIPFVLSSVNFLTPGGKIGMVIPSEILHVLYASELRAFLLSQCSRVLLIDPEDIWFEDTLQGAMILFAEKKHDHKELCKGISILRTKGQAFTNCNPVELFESAEYTNGKYLENKWTYALLSQTERSLLESLRNNSKIKSFSELAQVDVGIVTGANNYFLVNDTTVEAYNLSDVAYPMFGRSEHCPGVIYDIEQHRINSSKGLPTNFIWLRGEEVLNAHRDYVILGEEQQLHTRYKCRIRKPWYTVPSVYSSPVSMLKRSNGMPRLILNEMNAFTTDTAYRIRPLDGINAESLVCCFLNSITSLVAELEGRHYGGGVLELVPSEIERLIMPYSDARFVDIKALNVYVKSHTMDEVLTSQDKNILQLIGMSTMDTLIIHNALIRLRERRQRINEDDE